MRGGSDDLKEVLAGGGFTPRFFCDIFAGSARRMEQVPIVNPVLRWNSEQSLPSSADVTVVWASDGGESVTPRRATDQLAPFGPQAIVYCEISADQFREVIQLGRYRISGVPSSQDQFMDFMGQRLVSGSVVDLSLLDLGMQVDRWGFRVPEVPPSLGSCFEELGRITGATIVRSVPDQPIPASVVYEANRGGRWKAVQQLAEVLGGRAVFDSFGSLTIVPDESGPVVAELVLGDRGTILDVGSSMESEEVYNEVVGNFEDDDRNPIYSVDAIESGPLSVYGNYGVNTYYVSSPLVKTQSAADAFVATRLKNLSAKLTYRVKVSCLLNPLLEVGDVVSVEREDETITGRLVSHQFGADGTMSVELEVARVL